MAGRIRTVKPEWIEDERMLLASPAARVLSIALILMADDYGRGRGNPDLIVSRIFPGHSREGSEGLAELQNMGFTRLYTVRGQTYFEIINWSRHQRVDKPGKPRVPAPSDADENIPETLAKVPGSLAPDHDHDHDHDQREGGFANSLSRDSKFNLAAELWDEQEQLRAGLDKAGIPCRPVSATPGSVQPIIAILAEHSADDCRHVLAVFHAEAKSKRDAQWFNGVSNWRPDNFRRALAKPAPGAKRSQNRMKKLA